MHAYSICIHESLKVLRVEPGRCQVMGDWGVLICSSDQLMMAYGGPKHQPASQSNNKRSKYDNDNGVPRYYFLHRTTKQRTCYSYLRIWSVATAFAFLLQVGHGNTPTRGSLGFWPATTNCSKIFVSHGMKHGMDLTKTIVDLALLF